MLPHEAKIWLWLTNDRVPPRVESSPDGSLVKTRLPLSVIPAVYDEVVPVEGVKEVVEAEVEAEAEAEVEMEAGMTMTTWMPCHWIKWIPLDVIDGDDEPTNSSTTPRWNNYWHKSCKISDRGPRDVTLRGL